MTATCSQVAAMRYWLNICWQCSCMLHWLDERSATLVQSTSNWLAYGETVTCCHLKLPFQFAAWHFWTFYNKSHNMNAWVIIWKHWSYMKALAIHDHHFSHLLVYMETVNFCGSLYGLLEYFCEKKLPPRLPMQITWPWPSVGRFSHGLITVTQTKMWTQSW